MSGTPCQKLPYGWWLDQVPAIVLVVCSWCVRLVVKVPLPRRPRGVAGELSRETGSSPYGEVARRRRSVEYAEPGGPGWHGGTDCAAGVHRGVLFDLGLPTTPRPSEVHDGDGRLPRPRIGPGLLRRTMSAPDTTGGWA